MATTRKKSPTTPDGKPLCDACEENEATKYCLKCPGPLCEDCTKSHLKSKLTKTHELCDISKSGLPSVEKSGESLGLSKCPKHVDNDLDVFCSTCICFICDDCKSDHYKHSLKPAKSDIAVYQVVYNSHMENLSNGVHDLEQYKKVLDDTIQKYEYSFSMIDESEDDLVNTIRENAKRLRHEIRKVQFDLKTNLGDAQHGLIKEIDAADMVVSKLREVKKVTDCEVLSHQLVASKNALEHLNDYKKKVTPLVRVPRADQTLPYFNQRDSIKEDLSMFFIMNTPLTNAIHVNENISRNFVYKINEPIGIQGYRFSKSRCTENLVIYGKNTNDIRLLDENLAEIKQIKCNFEVWNMVAVSRDEIIALHQGSEKLSLIDENFDIILTQETLRSVKAVCCSTQHQFILCEVDGDLVYFSVMSVKGKSLVRQREDLFTVIENPWYIEMYPNGEIGVATNKSPEFYTVNLAEDTISKKEEITQNITAEIWSLLIDTKGNTFIGDADGNIHMFDGEFKHKVIANIDCAVRDMVVKGGQLLVSGKDNNIYVFS